MTATAKSIISDGEALTDSALFDNMTELGGVTVSTLPSQLLAQRRVTAFLPEAGNKAFYLIISQAD